MCPQVQGQFRRPPAYVGLRRGNLPLSVQQTHRGLRRLPLGDAQSPQAHNDVQRVGVGHRGLHRHLRQVRGGVTQQAQIADVEVQHVAIGVVGFADEELDQPHILVARDARDGHRDLDPLTLDQLDQVHVELIGPIGDVQQHSQRCGGQLLGGGLRVHRESEEVVARPVTLPGLGERQIGPRPADGVGLLARVVVHVDMEVMHRGAVQARLRRRRHRGLGHVPLRRLGAGREHELVHLPLAHRRLSQGGHHQACESKKYRQCAHVNHPPAVRRASPQTRRLRRRFAPPPHQGSRCSPCRHISEPHGSPSVPLSRRWSVGLAPCSR